MADPILTHKVVNIDKVVKSKRKTLAQYEATYEANAKYDGCFAFVCLNEHAPDEVLSRTGERYVSCDGQANHLGYILADEVQFHGGLVLLAEAWSPDLDFSTLNGKFRAGIQNYELQLVVFDCLTSKEFLTGHSPVTFAERMGRLAGKLNRPVMSSSLVMASRAQRWEPGTYDALELVSKLTQDPRGFDGLILADQNGTWTAGRGTTGEKVRIKQKLSFDLEVMTFTQGYGEKTGRPVYTMEVAFKGKLLGVGSGMPHTLEACPKIGDIVEIEAMDYSSEGLLREPRYKGIRHDKTEADT